MRRGGGGSVTLRRRVLGPRSSATVFGKKSQGPLGEFHATTSIRGGAFFVHPQRESLEKSNKTIRGKRIFEVGGISQKRVRATQKGG